MLGGVKSRDFGAGWDGWAHIPTDGPDHTQTPRYLPNARDEDEKPLETKNVLMSLPFRPKNQTSSVSSRSDEVAYSIQAKLHPV